MFKKRKGKKKRRTNKKVDITEINDKKEILTPNQKRKENIEKQLEKKNETGDFKLDATDMKMIEKMIDQGKVHEPNYISEKEKLLSSIRNKELSGKRSSNSLNKNKRDELKKTVAKKGGYSGSVPIDYNPSRCADFYRSGYCGFGNSCIYAHVRGEYEHGWEQEKEWSKRQK